MTKRRAMAHDVRVLLFALGAGLPALVTALYLIGSRSSLRHFLSAGIPLVAFWVLLALAARERVLRPLQTAANLIASLREGDFATRGRGARPGDPVGALFLEINALADQLQKQRFGSVEAGTLLRRVIEALDVAVIAFDIQGRALLANPAAERLLGGPLESLESRTAGALGLGGCLQGPSSCTTSLSFPGGQGPFEVRRTSFRLDGLPHELLVLADLRRALREEERQAWQRLVRVLGHEINNSLTPIQSIASDLRHVLAAPERHAGWQEDAAAGLEVIERRAGGLGRFLTGYARLSRLPPPSLAAVDVPALLRRVAALEARLPVTVIEGPVASVHADADQLEQLLINLVRNATDAALEASGGVRVSWAWLDREGQLEILVEDDGPGVAQTANLFVPFFTTKAQGTGIGLALSRQIAEAHRGSLSLENRTESRGARARLRLPVT